jgi:hypothetical protein
MHVWRQTKEGHMKPTDLKRYRIRGTQKNIWTGVEPDGEWMKAEDVIKLFESNGAHGLSEDEKDLVNYCVVMFKSEENLKLVAIINRLTGKTAHGVACLNGHDLTNYVKCGYCFDELTAQPMAEFDEKEVRVAAEIASDEEPPRVGGFIEGARWMWNKGNE